MKKREIVRKEKEFNNLILNAEKKENKFFLIFFANNNLDYPRFGITVGKKTGNAVIRNKYKRKVKSIIDQNKFIFPNGFDYIIIVKKACIGLPYIELQRSLINATKEEKR